MTDPQEDKPCRDCRRPTQHDTERCDDCRTPAGRLVTALEAAGIEDVNHDSSITVSVGCLTIEVYEDDPERWTIEGFDADGITAVDAIAAIVQAPGLRANIAEAKDALHGLTADLPPDATIADHAWCACECYEDMFARHDALAARVAALPTAPEWILTVPNCANEAFDNEAGARAALDSYADILCDDPWPEGMAPLVLHAAFPVLTLAGGSTVEHGTPDVTALRFERDTLAAEVKRLREELEKPVAGAWVDDFRPSERGYVMAAIKGYLGGWSAYHPNGGPAFASGPETGDAGRHAADLALTAAGYRLVGGVHPLPSEVPDAR